MKTIENRKVEFGDDYDKPYSSINNPKIKDNDTLNISNHIHLDEHNVNEYPPGLNDTIDKMNSAKDRREADKIYKAWILGLKKVLPKEEYEKIYEDYLSMKNNKELDSATYSITNNVNDEVVLEPVFNNVLKALINER